MQSEVKTVKLYEQMSTILKDQYGYTVGYTDEQFLVQNAKGKMVCVVGTVDGLYGFYQAVSELKG